MRLSSLHASLVLLALAGCGAPPVLVAPLRYVPVAAPAPDVTRDAPPALAPVVDAVDAPARETSLPNGVHVVFIPRHDVPHVSIELVIDRGAVDLGDAGAITTAEEEFFFRRGGSGRASARRASVQARIGADVQSETDPSGTRLGTTVSTGHLDDGLALLADVATATELAQDEYDRLVPEWRQRGKNYRLAMLRRLLFGASSPYGHLDWGKEPKDRASLQEARRAIYQPSHATLVIVGDVSADAVDAGVTRAFGAWAGSGLPKLSAPPALPEGDHVVLVPNGTKQTFAAVLARGPNPASDDVEAFELAGILLGGAPSSRLFDELRAGQGAAYTPGAAVTMERDVSSLAIVSMYEPYKLVDGVSSVVVAIGKVRVGEVTDADVATAREVLLGRWREEMATTLGTATAYARAILAGRRLDAVRALPERVSHVSKGDVVRVSNAYLANSALRLALIGPNQGLNVGPIGLGGLGGISLGPE